MEKSKISRLRPLRSPGGAGGRWGSSGGSCGGRGVAPGFECSCGGLTGQGKSRPPASTCGSTDAATWFLWLPALAFEFVLQGRITFPSSLLNSLAGLTIKLIRDRLTFHVYGSPIKIGDPKGSQVIEASVTPLLKERGRIWGCKEEGFSQEGRGEVWKIEVALLCR